MLEFWKTKQFRSLYLVWNQKLKESGFEDAEDNSDRLKQRASNSYRQASDLERETRLEYYLRLSSFVFQTTFENPIDELIMHKHAEGASIKEIVDHLISIGQIRHRKTIRLTIRRYQLKWGMKPRLLSQMSRKKVAIR